MCLSTSIQESIKIKYTSNINSNLIHNYKRIRMATAITKENFDVEVKQADKPVIIDVFAPWCGPCQQMMPIFEELEKEHGQKYKFVKLNVDESRDIATQYGVTSIPTFIFIKDDQVIGKETGYVAKEDLAEKIVELLG